MEQMILLREALIVFYKRNQGIINFIAKFCIGFFIASRLSHLGSLSFSKTLLINIAFGAAAAVVPPNGFYILAMLTSGFYLFTASIELSIMALIFFFLIIVFFARIFPKQSMLIPAVLLAFYFKVPYIIPIIAGVYAGLIGIIPVGIGVFIWKLIPFIPDFIALAPKAEFAPLSMPDVLVSLYTKFMEIASGGVTDWISTVVIFSLAIIAVYILSHLQIGYAREMSVLVGGGVLFFGVLFAVLMNKSQIGILGAVVSILASIGISYIILFYDLVLDYPSTERVEFEDKENYYYVKVVPKVLSHARHRQERNSRDYYDDYE